MNQFLLWEIDSRARMSSFTFGCSGLLAWKRGCFFFQPPRAKIQDFESPKNTHCCVENHSTNNGNQMLTKRQPKDTLSWCNQSLEKTNTGTATKIAAKTQPKDTFLWCNQSLGKKHQKRHQDNCVGDHSLDKFHPKPTPDPLSTYTHVISPPNFDWTPLDIASTWAHDVERAVQAIEPPWPLTSEWRTWADVSWRSPWRAVCCTTELYISFTQGEVCNILCVRVGDERDELPPLHKVESAPVTSQWHGRTTVSDHLPSDKLESTDELRRSKGIRATVSAQCIKTPKNMRAVWCIISTSSAQIVKYSFNITPPVSRSWLGSKCESVCGSSWSKDLESASFFLYHLFDEELELSPPCQPLTPCHCHPCRRTFFRFLQSGMLGGGNGVYSTFSRLLQAVRLWPMFRFCCGSNVFSFWSFCNTVPLCYFLFRLHLVTEDSADSFPSDIDRKCYCTAFFTALFSCSRAW